MAVFGVRIYIQPNIDRLVIEDPECQGCIRAIIDGDGEDRKEFKLELLRLLDFASFFNYVFEANRVCLNPCGEKAVKIIRQFLV